MGQSCYSYTSTPSSQTYRSYYILESASVFKEVSDSNLRPVDLLWGREFYVLTFPGRNLKISHIRFNPSTLICITHNDHLISDVLLLWDTAVSCQLPLCLVNAALYTALENYFITSETKHKNIKSKVILVTGYGGL
jgi:hypothetical protein